MPDNKNTITDLKKLVAQFINEREWEQFHTPKNLSMALSAEAAEFMEFLLWIESKDSIAVLENERSDVEDEVADICIALLSFCTMANIDLSTALATKLKKHEAKYPVEKSRGRWTKYNKL